jgi:hypothetical protein
MHIFYVQHNVSLIQDTGTDSFCANSFSREMAMACDRLMQIYSCSFGSTYEDTPFVVLSQRDLIKLFTDLVLSFRKQVKFLSINSLKNHSAH